MRHIVKWIPKGVSKVKMWDSLKIVLDQDAQVQGQSSQDVQVPYPIEIRKNSNRLVTFWDRKPVWTNEHNINKSFFIS